MAWPHAGLPRRRRVSAAREVERFDREHEALLDRIAPDTFTILHRLDAHILKPK